MPEGDTIFRAARTLDRALRGRTVERFRTAYAHVAVVDEQEPIAGRTVEAVTAVGKHLLVRFSGGLVLRTHLRMNGSWHVYRRGERWRLSEARARVVIDAGEFLAVGFDVPEAEWTDERKLGRGPVGELGPDLLAPQPDLDEAARRFAARGSEEVGQVLLDQRVAAGIGNVFKSEILFICRVNPFAPASGLGREAVDRLFRTARAQLQRNVDEAGVAHRRTTASRERSQALYVYGRSGRPCRRCGTAIAFRKQGPQARSTYWCPRCQPGPVSPG